MSAKVAAVSVLTADFQAVKGPGPAGLKVGWDVLTSPGRLLNLFARQRPPLREPVADNWPEEFDHLSLRELADLPLGPEPRFRD